MLNERFDVTMRGAFYLLVKRNKRLFQVSDRVK